MQMLAPSIKGDGLLDLLFMSKEDLVKSVKVCGSPRYTAMS